jgi:uncharacterized iron-regulated membrane protein
VVQEVLLRQTEELPERKRKRRRRKKRKRRKKRRSLWVTSWVVMMMAGKLLPFSLNEFLNFYNKFSFI